MRIIAGKARGLKLKTPRGMTTRPTADRIKESLFGILTCMLDFNERRVLDLFAGSGALGLESLSRGAQSAVFVDRASTDCIIDNAQRAHFDCVEVIRADVFRALDRLSDQKFDLIFVDPPYHRGLAQNAVELIVEKNILTDDGLLSVELGIDEKLSSTLERVRRIEYGRTTAIEIFGRTS